jgi:hypothetical protein
VVRADLFVIPFTAEDAEDAEDAECTPVADGPESVAGSL